VVTQTDLVVEDEALERKEREKYSCSNLVQRDLFTYINFNSCVKSISHHRTVLNLPSRLHLSPPVSSLRGVAKKRVSHVSLLSGSYRRVLIILSILCHTNLCMLNRFIVKDSIELPWNGVSRIFCGAIYYPLL
jgi:hypothetical protein